MMLASIVLPNPTSSARMARPPMSRSTRWATSIWCGSSLIALASSVISRSNPGTRAMRSASRRSSYQARSAGGCLSWSTNSFRERSSTAQESSGSGLGSGNVTAMPLALLREHTEAAGLRPGFGVADEQYQKVILGRLHVPLEQRGALLNRFSRHRAQDYRLTPEDARLYREYAVWLAHRNMLD